MRVKKTESADLPDLKERLQTVDGMFVLAAGYPGEVWMADEMETLGILGALEHMPKLRGIYFVGGKSEMPEIPHLSVQNAERFTDRLNRQQKSPEDNIYGGEVHALAESNNTGDNLKEVKEAVLRDNLQNITIVSTEYHLPRIRQLCKRYGIDATFISAEELIAQRSPRHQALVERYASSCHYRRMLLQNRFLIIYGLLDPEYRVIRVIRERIRRFR